MKQGELWYAILGPVLGSEQDGYRPVLIISGNMMNQYAPVVICCPLTTKIKQYKGNPILPPSENGLSATSEVLVSHIRSISKDRLSKRICEVPESVIAEVKQTLKELMTF
jgi:mRNA interferase MazF